MHRWIIKNKHCNICSLLICIFCTIFTFSKVLCEKQQKLFPHNPPLGCGSSISLVWRTWNWNLTCRKCKRHYICPAVSFSSPCSSGSLSLPALSSLTFCFLNDPQTWKSSTLTSEYVLGLLELSVLVSNTLCLLRRWVNLTDWSFRMTDLSVRVLRVCSLRPSRCQSDFNCALVYFTTLSSSSAISLWWREALVMMMMSCVSPVFLHTRDASQILSRRRRANQVFEEWKQGNMERECIEERCSYEEAREIFEDVTKTVCLFNSFLYFLYISLETFKKSYFPPLGPKYVTAADTDGHNSLSIHIIWENK